MPHIGNGQWAIGDGPNDVGTILQADVWVGMSGKEGRQTVFSVDYSFTLLRF
jgi:magnesium-transporting ATPase (P-type)